MLAPVTKFGSWCVSSHAAGQSLSTNTAVPVVREGGVITALRLLRGTGISYGRDFLHFYILVIQIAFVLEKQLIQIAL